MEILIITSEIAPYSGHSDLSALAAALPKGLRGLEHHVVVISPLYGCVDPTAHSLARRLSTLPIALGGETQDCALYDGRTTSGIDLLFIGHPAFGAKADARDNRGSRARALVLSQAAAAAVEILEPRPDVVHALGFQAALALPLCRASAAAGSPVTVLSPHTLDEQGQFPPEELAALRPGPAALSALRNAPAENLLAAGLGAADRVVTPSHAAEKALRDSDASQALQAALEGRTGQLTSVLLGLDSAYWNPLTDSHITARYDAADTGGKDQCKGALQYELGLPARPDTPVIAVAGGTPDSEECGALSQLLHNDVQVVIATEGQGPAALSAALEKYGDKLKCMPHNEHGALHRLISGADFLCIPHSGTADSVLHLSGLRYGTLPIACAGGPAAETLVDCDADTLTGNGFLFSDKGSFLSALQRALAAFAQSDAFDALRSRAMRTDVSWERAARRFEHVYRAELSRR